MQSTQEYSQCNHNRRGRLVQCPLMPLFGGPTVHYSIHRSPELNLSVHPAQVHP